MRLCIVGCGAAGLCSARQALAYGLEVTVFERSNLVGGTWVYTDRTGTDEYGLPIHTSMYKSLRTNLPKEIMGYPDFPIPDGEISYLPAEKILSFLESYANYFKLIPHIQFSHYVKQIKPDNDKWLVTVVDLNTSKWRTEEFDAVAVCNGHYHTPLVSKLDGDESFTGVKIHSHDYRDPGPFKGKNVVVIGAGPSGIDLSLEIASTANKVILSHHHDVEIKNVFPENVEQRLDVIKVSESLVTFQDSSTFEADVLFYCTGYKYSFPFLSIECGITVENNYVEPLYKHMINIERPTMALIGLPFYVCAFSLFDLQARLFMKSITGEVKLPDKDAMYADTKAELAVRKKLGLKQRQYHMMGPLQGDYYDDLALLGELEPLSPVMTKLHNEASRRQLEDLVDFRSDNYKIVDQNNFIKIDS